MKRRTIATSTLLVVFTAFAAGATPIDGTGKVGVCPEYWKILLKPALTDAGSGPGTTKVKTKTPTTLVPPCSGATGDGLNVVKAIGKGEGPSTSTACTSLLGPMNNVITLTVKW